VENKAANFAAFAVLKCGFFIAKLFFLITQNKFAERICGTCGRGLK